MANLEGAMADRTAAERQRRYRARKRAEQAQHASEVTASVTPGVTRDAVTAPEAGPRELGARGRRLWQQVASDGPALKPAELVLLEEACRTADRLDVLDRILRGDEDYWVRLHTANEDGSIVKVVLNNALAEARQQQVALKALLAELRTSQAGGPAKPGAGKQPAPAGTGGGGVAGVADIAARIAARRAQAAG
ncbi:hypothetical protein [Micromonospora sp. WMMD980]|uniref:hypothetical protein n=1 Tax=Micromonospora sp. WMMD980 TaxID=3016088 RepID=UPI0024161B55|nr:hypothetical protein [Micromonospora sp. WMMD980]MDG4799038.1 hypothetical protein [Micromonospora sp. WMMD980]